MLIGMETILEIIETAIATALVKSAIPSSVILVGPSGAGKSQALILYSSVAIPTIRHSDDLTSRGIDDAIVQDKENLISHFLCPDFNVVLSHKDSVVNLTSAKLMTLMSDGVCRVDDGRQVKEVVHRQTGILTAMTNKVYTRVSKKWDMLGFKRRFVPIFFDYSAQTKTEVQDSIRNGRSKTTVVIKRNPFARRKLEPVEVKIKPKEAFVIETLSSLLAQNLSYHPAREAKTGKIIAVAGDPFLEFSPHHVLRTMASGHAILRGRRVVTGKDIEFLAKMIDFCKYGSPMRI